MSVCNQGKAVQKRQPKVTAEKGECSDRYLNLTFVKATKEKIASDYEGGTSGTWGWLSQLYCLC